MRRKAIIIALLILVAIIAELFYFRFHTYFQRKEVNEVFPTISSTPANGSVTDVKEDPQIIVQGQFVEVDLVHKGSGTASIIEQDGKRIVI